MRPLLPAALLLMAHAASAQAPYPFTLHEETDPQGVHLVARNPGPLPVAVVWRMDGGAGGRVVPSHTTLTLARLGATPHYRVQFDAEHQIGDLDAVHVPFHEYRLPFADGHSFMVSQAPGGLLTTHATPASWHALDIAMPEGTPVVAARSGIVVEATCGTVRILHDDGTIAGYHHLAADGIAVGEGEGVAAGRVIGTSGSTGHSSGPHLHFVVTRLVLMEDRLEEVSEPVTFYAGRPARSLRARTGTVLTSDYQEASLP